MWFGKPSLEPVFLFGHCRVPGVAPFNSPTLAQILDMASPSHRPLLRCCRYCSGLTSWGQDLMVWADVGVPNQCGYCAQASDFAPKTCSGVERTNWFSRALSPGRRAFFGWPDSSV